MSEEDDRREALELLAGDRGRRWVAIYTRLHWEIARQPDGTLKYTQDDPVYEALQEQARDLYEEMEFDERERAVIALNAAVPHSTRKYDEADIAARQRLADLIATDRRSVLGARLVLLHLLLDTSHSGSDFLGEIRGLLALLGGEPGSADR